MLRWESTFVYGVCVCICARLRGIKTPTVFLKVFLLFFFFFIVSMSLSRHVLTTQCYTYLKTQKKKKNNASSFFASSDRCSVLEKKVDCEHRLSTAYLSLPFLFCPNNQSSEGLLLQRKEKMLPSAASLWLFFSYVCFFFLDFHVRSVVKSFFFFFAGVALTCYAELSRLLS